MTTGDREIRRLPKGFELQPGFHSSPEDGMCALEAVAWIAGLPHNDQPSCVCPVLATFLRTVNDRMTHLQRQRLVAVLPRLVDTRDPGLVVPRARVFAWRALTIFAPLPIAERGQGEAASQLAQMTRLDLEGAFETVVRVADEVEATAWAEAKENGGRYWHLEFKVSSASRAAVEVAKLARDAIDRFDAEDEAEELATTAARIVAAACRQDNSAWSRALETLEALLALGEEEATVVDLEEYRRAANRAA